MTTGGTGMEMGDDYVAARLSIEIPSEGVSGIREIREEVDRFRTSMEAATRSEADMTRYLGDMAEASKRAAEAQSNVVQQTEMFLSLQARMGGAGLAGSSGVPAGVFQQPFSGSSGMGLPVPPGSRMPNPSDVVYQLNSASGRSPREYLNMQAARGNISSGDSVNLSATSIQSLADKIAEREKAQTRQAQATGGHSPHRQGPGAIEGAYGSIDGPIEGVNSMANQVLHELGPAGTHMGMAGLAMHGLNWAQRKLQSAAARRAQITNAPGAGGGAAPGGGEPGADGGPDGGDGMGMLGSLATKIPVVGGVLAAGMAAMGMVQGGGQLIQNYRNMASVRGGAAGEGFQLSMAQRGLQMDPFISGDQARQTYQAMLSEGYANSSGGGAEDVKKFLTQNIKDFNMEVGESVQWLRASGKGTKDTLDGLTTSLGQLKSLSGQGWQSFPDLRQETLQRTQQLVAQGVDPAQARMGATSSAFMFADDPILAGSLTRVPMTPQSSAMMMAFGGPNGGMADMPPGLFPNQFGRYAAQTGQSDELILNAAAKWAKIAQQTGKDTTGKHDSPGWLNATGVFFQTMQSLAPGSDYATNQQASDELYDKLVWQGQTPESILKEGHDKQKETAQANRPSKKFEDYVGGRGNIPADVRAFANGLNRIITTYKGAKDIEVMKDGKVVGQLDPKNMEQMEGLDSGQLQWRHKGDTGKGITLAETPDTINPDYSTDRPFASAGPTPGQGARGDNQKGAGQATVRLELTGGADKLFKVVGPNPMPLTGNQAAANAGQGTAQVNNPPPGDNPMNNHWWN